MIKNQIIKKYIAFTLAELLIALAILGVIATFTIPKVLQSQNNAQRNAIFKETFSALADINYQGWSTGEMTTSNNGDYVFTRLNAIKLCPNDSTAEGCAPPSASDSGFLTAPGVVLANGAMVMLNVNGPIWDGDCVNSYLIDANGSEGPNVMREDQWSLEFNCTATTTQWTSNRPGVLRANGYSTNHVAYEEMEYSIFSN